MTNRKTIKFFADEMLTAREILNDFEFGDLQTRLWDYILFGLDRPPDDRTMLALYKTLTRKEDVKEAAYEKKRKYREKIKVEVAQEDRVATAAEFVQQIRDNLNSLSNS